MDFKNTIYWGKQYLFRRKAFNEYRNANSRDLMTKEELTKINWVKRKEIVHFAYNNIKYYREKYDNAGFHPLMLKHEEDWERIPIIKKHDIKNNIADIINKNIARNHFITTTTGGSTGEPIKTYRDRRFPEDVLKCRILKRHGVGPGDDIGMFWRIPPSKNRVASKILDLLIWFPTKRIKYDASLLNGKDFLKMTRSIKNRNRLYIWGYTGAIEQFALFLKTKNIYLENISLVWATAAPVTELQKKLFREVFKANVMNQYAFSEIHFVASSCPGCDNLLVDTDYRHVDIINEEGNKASIGEIGEIIVTDLENKVFPLIKYNIEDKTQYTNHNCTNKYPYPTIAPVMGRKTDVLKFKNGVMLSGEYLTTIFDEYTDYIQKFQFYQHSNYDIDIKVVSRTTPEKTNMIVEKVIYQIEKRSKSKTVIKKYIINDIPSDRGKNRYIISEIT